MKKLFLGVMAIAAMVACSNESVIVDSKNPITFGSEFVQNSITKAEPIDPTYNNDSAPLHGFTVWGFVTRPSGNLFDGDLVSRASKNDPWVCSKLAYWEPNKTYKFAAFAPYGVAKCSLTLDNGMLNSDGNLLKVTYENTAGDTDILYSTATVVTGDNVLNQEPVKMTFFHLLSKIRFTFTNALGENDFRKVTVTDVVLTAPANGSLDLTTAKADWAWELGAGTVDLQFGNMQSAIANAQSETALNERLTIPFAVAPGTTTDYKVSFKVVITQGTESCEPIEVTSNLSGVTLRPGKCYNFTALLNEETLKLKKIEFTAEVEEWVDGDPYEVEVVK